tara:strand:- start:13263 stop:13625 length:363 start_codon:yes stop_codon:yes gene_type:complete
MTLEQSPIWDQEALKGRLRGKTDRMVKLVNLFLDDMPPRMDLLKEQVLAANHADIGATAHTIKGVSANLGIMRLQFRAGELEQAAKNLESDKALFLLAAISDEYEQSEAALKAFVLEHSE